VIVVVSALASITLAGCGGSAPEAGAPAAASAPSARGHAPRPTTTSPAQQSPAKKAAARRRAPKAWTGDGTPEPALHNTGSDYAAIFRSLDAYRLWLAAHHPDPSKVSRVWSYGTQDASDWAAELRELQRAHHRTSVTGYRADVRVVSVTPTAVTLLVDSSYDGVTVTDDAGRAVRRYGSSDAHLIVLLHAFEGRWTIASTGERLDPHAEVHL
jgi:hypothetical protein